MELIDLYQNLKNIQSSLEKGDIDDVNIDNLLNEAGLDLNELEEKMMRPDSRLLLNFAKNNNDAVSPYYNYETDSGFDLYSVVDVTIEPFGRTLIPTGLSFDIKDGYEIQVRSKSGLALNQGLMVLNSPGTVDNGYTGEVKVIIFNTNPNPIKITNGMKIAQAVICPVINGKWVNIQQVDVIEDKDRNSNGFGSTGI